ncbi:hypothetical protein V8E54_014521 [Elaphomyces granulatus]
MSSGSPIIAAFASARTQQQNSPLNNNTLLDDDTASDPDFDPEPLSREGTNDPEPEFSATDGRKRKPHQVSTLQARIKVVKWNGKSGLFARVIKEFPGDFRGSPNANFMKASRLSVIKSLYMDQC